MTPILLHSLTHPSRTLGASFSSHSLFLLHSFPTIVVWRIQITTSRDIRSRKGRKGKICTRKRERPDGRRRQLFSGRCNGEQILIMPSDRKTDNERTNESTLSEIYVSSKCETNSAFLLNNCPLPPLLLSILRIWSPNADQAAGSYTGEAREGEDEKSKYSLLPPFVSRFGTVPIYLSIFCAMHFSAKLTPSGAASTYVHTSLFSPSFRCFYAHFPYIYLACSC